MKRILIFISLVCSATAQAQTAAIGRLFTTPEERYRLDVQRGLVAAPPPAPAPQAAPPAPAPAPVTVNGVVRRSSGQSTVWMNRTPQPAPDLGGTASDPRVTVTLPNGARVQIKPGQTVDMNAGSVRDVDAP